MEILLPHLEPEPDPAKDVMVLAMVGGRNEEASDAAVEASSLVAVLMFLEAPDGRDGSARAVSLPLCY